jgi:hypothetical protein
MSEKLLIFSELPSDFACIGILKLFCVPSSLGFIIVSIDFENFTSCFNFNLDQIDADTSG